MYHNQMTALNQINSTDEDEEGDEEDKMVPFEDGEEEDEHMSENGSSN